MAQVSYWPLATDYTDTLGNNNGGAFGSGNTFAGGMLVLNGSGYAGKNGSITGVTGGNADRAMGVYFQPTTASSVEALMAVGNNANSAGFTIIKLSAISIRVDLYADALSFAVPALSNGVRYAIWVEYTAATKSARLWLAEAGDPATESSSGSQAFAANSNLVANHMYIGASDDAASLFTGSMQKATFYNGIPGDAARNAFFSEASFIPKIIFMS